MNNSIYYYILLFSFWGKV